MHPNFWLIMVCAVVAIGTGVIASKKKNNANLSLTLSPTTSEQLVPNFYN